MINGGGVVVSQAGVDTLIDMRGGNSVTVLNTAHTDVISHIVW